MQKNHRTHLKTEKNLIKFAKKTNVSEKAKNNLLWFFREIIADDSLEKTEFELSFKVKRDILNKGEIRLLNIDAGSYAYSNEANFLKRLLLYKKIVWNKTSCEKKKEIFSALESIAKTPLDLYGGADIDEDTISFAFWLILGGVEKSGKIKFIKNADVVLGKIFKALQIPPAFEVDAGDVLNVGFDLENKAAFYKIYYILNKKTEKFINKKQRDIVASLGVRLNGLMKHWFFVSERYIIDETSDTLGRKKIYLEFLEPVLTSKKTTYKLLEDIFKIVGCPCEMKSLWEYISVLEGKIVIIAFEKDGTVTFYIRI